MTTATQVEVKETGMIFQPHSFCAIIEGFEDGWDKINAKRGYSWASNPWVWAISFKKL